MGAPFGKIVNNCETDIMPFGSFSKKRKRSGSFSRTGAFALKVKRQGIQISPVSDLLYSRISRSFPLKVVI